MSDAIPTVGRLVHELVEEQARRWPAAMAVSGAGGGLSYGELEAMSNRLARHLRRRGVGAESVVGVCLERSPEAVVALLGVLKAGGAYLPLGGGHPGERLGYMLGNAEARLLVTREELAGRVPWDGEVLCLDRDREWLEEDGGGVESGLVAENLAYVVYTSGSTGRPKGVMVSHRGVVNLAGWTHE